MNRTDLSIVMPALDEEDNIRAAVEGTLSAFEDFDIRGEVIVINDGSTDRTREILTELRRKDPRVRIIDHHTPQGIGASFWDGVDQASSEFVCMLPGDNENDPHEIMRYWPLLEHVDMVIPFVYNPKERSPFRNTLSLMYRFIINTTFLVSFNYTNGTVIYRRSILEELDYRSKGFFFQTDILVRTVKRGYLFAEVPYRLGQRKSGASKSISMRSLSHVIDGYVRLARDIYFGGAGKMKTKFARGSMTARRR